MRELVIKYKVQSAVIAILVVAAIALAIVRSSNGGNYTEAAVEQGAIIDAVYGLGTVTARRSYVLKVGVTTTIREIFVQEGQFVKEGTPLVALVGTATFRTPFSGTVTSLPYKVDETVFPQTPVVTVTDLTDRYIVVSLEQQAAIRVKRGQNAVLSFETLRNRSFRARVRAVFSNEGQFIVHLDAFGLPDFILPGMTADVAIEIARHENAILVPSAALLEQKVIRVRGGHRKEIDVGVGIVDGARAEITSGDLKSGDFVLVRKQ